MSVVLVILAVLAGLAAAVVGGVIGALAFETVHSKGERQRFAAELAPLREGIGDLTERWDRWYKRNAKRQRDDAENPAASPASDTFPSRADRKAALRQRLAGRATLVQVARSKGGEG